VPKQRIDKRLVDLGLAGSRERARALIIAGRVLADEVPIIKPGSLVGDDAAIRIRGEDLPFVSRGGLKLEGALDDLGIDVRGKVVLDVGASTGGFSDCCLKRGAERIYAVDVGRNQLDWSLRNDPRVVSLEQTNARHLTPAMLPGPADLALIDVSFISLDKVLEPVSACLVPGGEVLAMVKPQFEVGRDKVGKGGVVRDESDRQEAVARVIRFAKSIGLALRGRADSRIAGPKGNVEVFVYLGRGAGDEDRDRG
jgi:23S rRNA (cytidine1920-2'-O)/16S rRNA (cytidine1409-2'-O)-methyltransferase